MKLKFQASDSRPPFIILRICLALVLLFIVALLLSRGLSGAPRNADTIALAPSQPVQREIAWRPVAGSEGYLLQLRDSSFRLILERRLEEPRAMLELQPGRYQLRVASLNKFGKPANWTAWAKLQIQRPREEQAAAAASSSQNEDNDTNKSNQNDGESQDIRTGEIARALIPGLSQYQRGQTWRGIAWMSAFASMSGAAYVFWQDGNALSLQAEAATPLLLLAPLSGQPALSLFLLQDRAATRAAYDAAQSNQQNIGWLAGILYLLQIADALWLSPETNPGANDASQNAFRFEIGTVPANAFAPRHAQQAPTLAAQNLEFQFQFSF